MQTFVKSSSHNFLVNNVAVKGSIQHWTALPCTSLSRTLCLILAQHDTPDNPLQFHGPKLRTPAAPITLLDERNASSCTAAVGESGGPDVSV